MMIRGEHGIYTPSRDASGGTSSVPRLDPRLPASRSGRPSVSVVEAAASRVFVLAAGPHEHGHLLRGPEITLALYVLTVSHPELTPLGNASPPPSLIFPFGLRS